MKHLLLTLLFSIPFIGTSQNNTNEVSINTKPAKVMVYINGALVESTGSALLKSTTKTIVFPNLSNYIDANSVQVKANTDISIMSVNYRLNYLKPTESKEYKTLQDSIDSFKRDMARLKIKNDGYKEELNILQVNKNIGGTDAGVSVAELSKMVDYYRIKYNETALKSLELTEKEADMNKELKRMEKQLNQIRNQGSKPTGEVVVQLGESVNLKTEFELSYYVTNCGWVPMYDIRVKDVNSKANITAKANVYQNTGDDWDNIKLALSTGNPSRSNTKPSLNPWQIYISNASQARAKRYAKSVNMDAPMQENRDESMNSKVEVARSLQLMPSSMGGSSVTPASSTTVNSETTNSVFNITIPYSIKSDGKDNTVEIQEYEVEAQYAYFAIPKLDKDAFLVSDLVGWDQSELLPGDANVYFENNYVGQTYFDSRIIDDTLSFALGRDNNVRVNRKKTKEFSETVSITGNYRKQTRAFEIELKNTRKSEIKVEIEDQIPLSTNEDLTVDLIGGSDAYFDKKSGILAWKLTLKPGESKVLKFGYSVRYPKSMRLTGY